MGERSSPGGAPDDAPGGASPEMEGSGQPTPTPPEPDGTGETGGASERPDSAELARQALQQAKADARRRGALPGRDSDGGSRARGRTGKGGGSDPGRGRTGGDPQPLGRAIEELVAHRGWEAPAAEASVFARWDEIVGAELAAHTRPESLSEGELVVVADSAAWATQLRLLARSLATRLCREIGEDSVRTVRVRGPGGGGNRSRRGRGSGSYG